MEKAQEIMELRQDVESVYKNKEVFNDLLKYSFKGLDEKSAGRALMEGAMKGFSVKDFMVGNVYAIPFGQTYSLVNSIDHVRKIAMASGLAGKSSPKFVENENGDVVSCEVTVKRNVNGHIGEYTALVYMNEYSTGRNLWKTKPRTMIAKVAEMHALRSAFPEEMQNVYVEEEYQRENIVDVTPEIDPQEYLDILSGIQTIEDLKAEWAQFPAEAQQHEDVVKAKDSLKAKLTIKQEQEHENTKVSE